MRRLAAALLILTVPPALVPAFAPALAMDPAQAGREARRDLDALMETQRREKTSAAEKAAKAAKAPPPRPSRADDDRAIKSLDSRVPTICRGC